MPHCKYDCGAYFNSSHERDWHEENTHDDCDHMSTSPFTGTCFECGAANHGEKPE